MESQKQLNNQILDKIGKLKSLPERPLVSIIIAAYNEEKYIETCIKSLLKQTYKPIEILIVNSESTDLTPEIVKKYYSKGVKLLNAKRLAGPGGAWNFGWKNSKGKILMFFDADHIYGEDYIKDLSAPVIKGEDICTMHNLERIANIQNIWARAFAKERATTKNGRGQIFTLIRRDVFEILGPFDPSLGYADDKTLFFKYNLTSLGVDTKILRFNPDSLKDHWKHGKWVGKSYQHPWRTILALPFFPLYVLYKSIKHFINDPYWKFIYFLPVYYTIKYFSYLGGAIEKLNKKNDK